MEKKTSFIFEYSERGLQTGSEDRQGIKDEKFLEILKRRKRPFQDTDLYVTYTKHAYRILISH